MERFPEVRLNGELASRVDAELATGETWPSLVRRALAADKPRRRPRRRAGPVSKALHTAIAASSFEDQDAAAVGLARHLAQRLDEQPSDAKYLAHRLLATLVELRLTPAARLGMLTAANEPERPPGVLEELRLHSAARQAGESGILAYLVNRDQAGRKTYENYAGHDVASRYYDSARPRVEAVTRALDALLERYLVTLRPTSPHRREGRCVVKPRTPGVGPFEDVSRRPAQRLGRAAVRRSTGQGDRRVVQRHRPAQAGVPREA